MSSYSQNATAETLSELEAELTDELKALEVQTLKIASVIFGRQVNLASLHGIIGGKNNTYTDVIRTAFPSPDTFIAAWYKGLMDAVEKIESDQKAKYAGNVYRNTPQHGHLRLAQDPTAGKYLETFLIRNFYRQLNERTRIKPDESHVALWFGENRMPWGLLIAPVFRGDWTNDVSEIRRAKYMYWTVGHVLSTGLVDPDNNDLVAFPNIAAFFTFCQSVLKRMSVSKYEQKIWDQYIEYVEDSTDPMTEPFLVPELRYAGRQADHKYRLDFTVLNSHTQEFVGFELSPQSTHMVIKGKDKTLSAHNKELQAKWDYEASKRNEYFAAYGISIVTFTDLHLKNIDQCFDEIKNRLQRRGEVPNLLSEQRARLMGHRMT